VFDTPLTVERAAALAGYVQSLAAWFMQDQPFVPAEDDYLVYTYNRFQACRFGLDAIYVDPATGKHMALREHILHTLHQIERHAESLGAASMLQILRDDVNRDHNDARWLRERQAEERLLAEVVRQAAHRLRGQAAARG
jgi:carboxylate-amine ligase